MKSDLKRTSSLTLGKIFKDSIENGEMVIHSAISEILHCTRYCAGHRKNKEDLMLSVRV